MAEKKEVKQKNDFKRKCSVGDFQLDFTFSEIDMSCLVGGSILGLEVIEKSLKILFFSFWIWSTQDL